ncbi:MAG: aminopeptidase P family protein [Veillonella sp.]|nr:aminopeptidase P family protein [Veillonella sp.]
MNGLTRLQDFLVQEGYEGMFVTSSTNLHYFAGFTGTAGVAFVTRDKAWFLTDSRYTEQAQGQCEGYTVIQYQQPIWEEIKALAEEHDVRAIAIEGDSMTVDEFGKVIDIFGDGFEFNSVQLQGLRAVKREDELVHMRKAAQIADEAFAVLLEKIKVGMTENEARIILETEMLKRGSDEPSFATIVASGHRSSMPHGVASDKVIEKGDFVTFDFGAVWKGYHSDMTRTICMGPASDEQKKLYEIVLNAQKKGVSAVRAGLLGVELDTICRDSIENDGYGAYFNHGLGHGVGLDIHEQPVASPRSESVLETNMIITVEPGVYLPGKIGLRIEDSVIVTDDGCEVLTHSPKELIEIEV